MSARFGDVLTPNKWVFVLGCYNSGTTLLANLLGAHPQLSALPREGVELCDALPRPEQHGWPRMWLKCEKEMQIAPEGGAERARRIKKQWSRHVPHSEIVVEKSIANITRLEFLARHFSPAYFVYVLRNGYAVAEGIRRRAKPPDWGRAQPQRYPIDLCAAQWAASDQRFERDRPSLPHLLAVRYETLADNPTDTLHDIAAFLDIEPFAADLATRAWTIHRTRSSIRNMNPDAVARLSDADLDAIDTVAGDTLRKHGYTRPQGNS